MPDEQYYALANLVKRPMRRWWARVGSWWMLGLGLLVIAQGLKAGFEIRQYQAGIYVNPFSSQEWYQFIRHLSTFTGLMVVAFSLNCVYLVQRYIQGITRDSLAFSKRKIMQATYRLALLNSWPPLLLIFPWYMIMAFRLNIFPMYERSAWLIIAQSILTSQFYTLWVVWLAAVGVVSRNFRWPVLALFCGGLIAPFIYLPLNPQPMRPNVFFPAYNPILFSSFELTLIAFSALALIYNMFVCFLQGKEKVASKICFAMSFLLLLAGLRAGFGFFPIDYIIQTGQEIFASFQIFGFNYEKYDEFLLKMYFGGYIREFPTHEAWAIVPVLSGIFWVFAHYLAFSWLMGRDWRKRGG